MCQEMPKSALGIAVGGQIWVLVQLAKKHCRMASNGTQLISLTKEAIMECAGGREPLCSVGNESEDPAYY